MPSSIREHYAALIAAGEIERDPAQEIVLAALAQLDTRLAAHRLARKSSSLGWLFGNRKKQAPLKGLYIYGKVGRGKTMLMDLFFEASRVSSCTSAASTVSCAGSRSISPAAMRAA